MREPPAGDWSIASLALGISVRLCSGMPMTPSQNSIDFSMSVTLMQYCERIETMRHQ